MCDCLHLVGGNVEVSHQKLLGFEEISTGRWSQYILNISGSNSEEIYGLSKSKEKGKKNVTFW